MAKKITVSTGDYSQDFFVSPGDNEEDFVNQLNFLLTGPPEERKLVLSAQSERFYRGITSDVVYQYRDTTPAKQLSFLKIGSKDFHHLKNAKEDNVQIIWDFQSCCVPDNKYGPKIFKILIDLHYPNNKILDPIALLPKDGSKEELLKSSDLGLLDCVPEVCNVDDEIEHIFTNPPSDITVVISANAKIQNGNKKASILEVIKENGEIIWKKRDTFDAIIDKCPDTLDLDKASKHLAVQIKDRELKRKVAEEFNKRGGKARVVGDIIGILPTEEMMMSMLSFFNGYYMEKEVTSRIVDNTQANAKVQNGNEKALVLSVANEKGETVWSMNDTLESANKKSPDIPDSVKPLKQQVFQINKESNGRVAKKVRKAKVVREDKDILEN